jgi:hypothetical protein
LPVHAKRPCTLQVVSIDKEMKTATVQMASLAGHSPALRALERRVRRPSTRVRMLDELMLPLRRYMGMGGACGAGIEGYLWGAGQGVAGRR